MTAAALLADLRARGVEFAREGDRLRWRAPRGSLSPDDLTRLRAQKAELLDLLPSNSPAARLELAWGRALARARQGFAETCRTASPDDLAGAAALELRLDQAVVPPFGPVAAEAAQAVPAGKQVCTGCADLMPEHPSIYCASCELGIDTGFDSRLMPLALDLRAKLGPAGGRGLRVAMIREAAASDQEDEADDDDQLDLDGDE